MTYGIVPAAMALESPSRFFDKAAALQIVADALPASPREFVEPVILAGGDMAQQLDGLANALRGHLYRVVGGPEGADLDSSKLGTLDTVVALNGVRHVLRSNRDVLPGQPMRGSALRSYGVLTEFAINQELCAIPKSNRMYLDGISQDKLELAGQSQPFVRVRPQYRVLRDDPEAGCPAFKGPHVKRRLSQYLWCAAIEIYDANGKFA